MVNVGIIGLGPVWESRYRPALHRLRHRIRVCAIYDPVASRAEQAADEFSATPVQGMVALLERRDQQAVLLLGGDWLGTAPLELARRYEQSVYVAGSLGENHAWLTELHDWALASGVTVMPEFSRRYTPATARLKELIATRIGRPHRIHVHAALPRESQDAYVPGQGPGVEFLIGLLDWCRYVVRTPPLRLKVTTSEDDLQKNGAPRLVTIEFQSPRSGGRPSVAELQILNDSDEPTCSEDHGDRSKIRFEIECERGNAIFDSGSEIAWRMQAAPDKTISESLASERSEVEVMLDHFCRRVVGGLIPLADVMDVCRCLALAQSIDHSLRTGEPATWNDPR